MTRHAHLMELPEHVCRVVKHGHAANPGTGPAGETCRTCKHKAAVHHARRYWKCGLTRATWTGGPGSDIRLKDPSCRYWEGCRDAR